MQVSDLLAVLLLVVMVLPVAAIPTTGAATAVGNNNVTFQGTGVAGTAGWFMWGMYSGKLYLNSGNVTPAAGSISKVVWDFPIMGSTTYYYKACDSTGCGNEVSFVTAAVTPLPTSTLGAPFINMTETHFDIAFMPNNLAQPFNNPFTRGGIGDIGYGILMGIVLFGVFLGMWFRGKNTVIPSFMGGMLAVVFMGTDYAMQFTLPPEYLAIAQGAFCACFAGMLMSLFKKG